MSSAPTQPFALPTSTATAADNVRRWDGARRGHYEVWYVTLHHAASETGYWIRYTLESPLDGVGQPYGQLWFARFDPRDPRRTFGINRKFPIASMTAEANPFAVHLGGNLFRHDAARGALAGDGHDVRWDLAWTPAPTTHHHLPKVMYLRGGLGETTVLSPSLDAPVTGSITVDGQTITFSGAHASERVGQTHLWGKKHAHAWAWGHCNAFDGRPGAAFEALTVRLRRRNVTLPPLTVLALYLDGEALAFNQFRHTPFTRGEMGTGFYRFRALGPSVRLEGEFSARPADMVLAHYEDPDGAPSYCANTCAGDLRITVFRRSGSRYREAARLLAPRRGHFEVATRSPDPAIEHQHVTVA
jgi:hypothetical protein